MKENFHEVLISINFPTSNPKSSTYQDKQQIIDEITDIIFDNGDNEGVEFLDKSLIDVSKFS